MSSKDRLIRNVLIFSIGNLGSRFLVFLLVPLFSYYLSTSEMSFFDMAVVTVGLVIPVAGLQLSESIYRWLLDVENTNLKKVISSSFLTLVVSMLIFVMLYCIITPFFSFKYKSEICVYFIVGCLYPFFLAISRGLKLNKLYALSGIINSIILVLSNWILLAHFSLGVKALFYANIVSNLITIILLTYGVKFFNYLSVKDYSKTLVIEFIKYSLPLIPNAVSWWFINSANRYIIIYFLGQESNGVYALSSRLAMALYALNSIFNLAWQESAITEFHKEDRDKLYSDTFNKYFVLEFTVIMVLIPLSKIYVQNFVGISYIDGWKYIPILFIGVAFATFASFFATGYMGAKKTMGAFTTTIVGACINIILACIFVPKLGLQGAAISLSAGFLVTWLMRIKQTKTLFKIKFDIKKMIRISVLLVLSLILVFTINNIYGLILFSIVAFLIFVIENKFMISKIMKKMKNRKGTSTSY